MYVALNKNNFKYSFRVKKNTTGNNGNSESQDK